MPSGEAGRHIRRTAPMAEDASAHHRAVIDQFPRQAAGFAARPELHAHEAVGLIVEPACWLSSKAAPMAIPSGWAHRAAHITVTLAERQSNRPDHPDHPSSRHYSHISRSPAPSMDRSSRFSRRNEHPHVFLDGINLAVPRSFWLQENPRFGRSAIAALSVLRPGLLLPLESGGAAVGSRTAGVSHPQRQPAVHMEEGYGRRPTASTRDV